MWKIEGIQSELYFTIGIGILIWVSYILYLLFWNKKPLDWINCFLWTWGWIGIFMLIIKPETNKTYNKSASFLSSDGGNTFDFNAIKKIDPTRCFTNIYEFLNSEIYNQTDTLHFTVGTLDQHDLELLEGIPIKYYATENIFGFDDINLPAIYANRPWLLSGNVKNRIVEKVILTDPAGKKSEGVPDSSGNFEIKHLSGPEGYFDFNLSAISGNDTLSEIVPIRIHENPNWKMLVISNHPSFEINYMKNFWGQMNQKFALKQETSLNKFAYSYINMPPIKLSALTSKVVSEFQMLSVDMDSWNNLGSSKRKIILNAVKDDGLTCIFRPTDNVLSAKDIPYHNIREDNDQTLIFQSGDIDISGYEISSGLGWEEITYDNITIGCFRNYGIGKLSISLIDNTYPLILSGHEKYYQNIWAEFYSKILLIPSKVPSISFGDWIWAGKETAISVYSPNKSIKSLSLNDSLPIPGIQIPLLKSFYSFKIWPIERWNKLEVNEDETETLLYAHPHTSWPLIKESKYLESLKTHNQKLNSSISTTYFRKIKISFIWGFLLMLLGFGGMWLKERISG